MSERFLQQLHPELITRIGYVLQELWRRGWDPIIPEVYGIEGTGYRSVKDQEILARFYPQRTHVKFGFHNVTDAEGHPQSMAVHVMDRLLGNHLPKGHPFLEDLQTAAQIYGLRTGNDWKGDSWDPFHVQLYENKSLQAIQQGAQPPFLEPRLRLWTPRLGNPTPGPKWKSFLEQIVERTFGRLQLDASNDPTNPNSLLNPSNPMSPYNLLNPTNPMSPYSLLNPSNLLHASSQIYQHGQALHTSSIHHSNPAHLNHLLHYKHPRNLNHLNLNHTRSYPGHNHLIHPNHPTHRNDMHPAFYYATYRELGGNTPTIGGVYYFPGTEIIMHRVDPQYPAIRIRQNDLMNIWNPMNPMNLWSPTNPMNLWSPLNPLNMWNPMNRKY